LIIFDEKKYAEKLLKKGFLTKHKNVYELHVLAKYYFSLGKTDDEVKEGIVLFCKKHVEHFNKDEWYKIINKTITSAQKSKFVTGKEVCITENELKCIKELEDLKEQKVAFVMLVLYKFYDFKRFEVSIEELYRLCKLNLNSKTKLKILQTLTAKELIDIVMGSKRWVKFAEKYGDSVIEISNFDDFIYEYEMYMGRGNYKNCDNCRKVIKITSNNKKYCEDCAKKMKNKKIAEINKRKRKGEQDV